MNLTTAYIHNYILPAILPEYGISFLAMPDGMDFGGVDSNNCGEREEIVADILAKLDALML